MNKLDENGNKMNSIKKIRPVYKRTHHSRQATNSAPTNQLARHLASSRKPARVSRRDFVKLGISTLGALVIAEAGLVGFMYFRSRSLEGHQGGKITAGPISDFPPGSITEFKQEGFFLINSTEGELKAVYRRCPHLGCNVEWLPNREQFYCPCHGSSFNAAGKFEQPPVPRSLDVFPVLLQKEMVVVDTSRALPNEVDV